MQIRGGHIRTVLTSRKWCQREERDKIFLIQRSVEAITVYIQCQEKIGLIVGLSLVEGKGVYKRLRFKGETKIAPPSHLDTGGIKVRPMSGVGPIRGQ